MDTKKIATDYQIQQWKQLFVSVKANPVENKSRYKGY